MRRSRSTPPVGARRLVQLNAVLDSAIEFSKVDLGRKPYTDVCSVPSPSKPQVSYPTIWIDDRDTPVDIPLSGKATIDYKVVSRTARERDGQTKHDATIEIQSIEPVDGAKKKDGTNRTNGTHGTNVGRAMPVKLGAIRPGMIQFSRSRNSDGQFEPESDGGVGPETMQAAYGTPSLGRTVGAAAGLGGTAAAALLIAKKLKGRGGQV